MAVFLFALKIKKDISLPDMVHDSADRAGRDGM